MKVKDCYTKITGEPSLVKKTDSIKEIIQKLSENPISRSVFVIDDNQNLVGIIDITTLFRVIRVRHLKEDAFTLLSEARARTAEDIMMEPISVSPDDDIENALMTALQHKLRDLPVTKDGKVIGDLNCFEILEGLCITDEKS